MKTNIAAATDNDDENENDENENDEDEDGNEYDNNEDDENENDDDDENNDRATTDIEQKHGLSLCESVSCKIGRMRLHASILTCRQMLLQIILYLDKMIQQYRSSIWLSETAAQPSNDENPQHTAVHVNNNVTLISIYLYRSNYLSMENIDT